jgi:hypothetical protein
VFREKFGLISLAITTIPKYDWNAWCLMAKYDGIKGQELLDVEEGNNEVTLIFKDNRFLFVKLENGKIVCDSVPE